jgi:hypothetical protein
LTRMRSRAGATSPAFAFLVRLTGSQLVHLSAEHRLIVRDG